MNTQSSSQKKIIVDKQSTSCQLIKFSNLDTHQQNLKPVNVMVVFAIIVGLS